MKCAGEGMSFVAETGSNHVVVMDGAPEAGGRNLAPRPMELVLAGNLVRLVATTSEGEVVIEVRDSGVGIPATVLPRLFDPFFTTKAAGHGFGLGLSLCYGLVREAGGRIEVDSAPGGGSTFRVVLPFGLARPGLVAEA